MSEGGSAQSYQREEGLWAGPEPHGGAHAADTASRRGRGVAAVVYVAAGVLACALVLLASTREAPSWQPSLQRQASFDADTEALVVEASNEYGNVQDAMMPYPFLQDALLVEPYKFTTLEVANAAAGCKYDWLISSDSGQVVRGTNTSGRLTVTLTEVRSYSLSLEEHSCDEADAGRTLETVVWVKYVRRELLSLSDKDRQDFLDAFSTLWKVGTVEGQALYGSKYKSLYYLATVHNDAGGNSVCDEFHGGIGKPVTARRPMRMRVCCVVSFPTLKLTCSSQTTVQDS